MADAEDLLLPALHLLDHLHAVCDAGRHRFLTQNVVPLLRELGDQRGVKIVLSTQPRVRGIHAMTYQDADEDRICHFALRHEVFVVRELHILGYPSPSSGGRIGSGRDIRVSATHDLPSMSSWFRDGDDLGQLWVFERITRIYLYAQKDVSGEAGPLTWPLWPAPTTARVTHSTLFPFVFACPVAVLIPSNPAPWPFTRPPPAAFSSSAAEFSEGGRVAPVPCVVEEGRVLGASVEGMSSSLIVSCLSMVVMVDPDVSCISYWLTRLRTDSPPPSREPRRASARKQ